MAFSGREDMRQVDITVFAFPITSSYNMNWTKGGDEYNPKKVNSKDSARK